MPPASAPTRSTTARLAQLRREIHVTKGRRHPLPPRAQHPFPPNAQHLHQRQAPYRHRLSRPSPTFQWPAESTARSPSRRLLPVRGSSRTPREETWQAINRSLKIDTAGPPGYLASTARIALLASSSPSSSENGMSSRPLFIRSQRRIAMLAASLSKHTKSSKPASSSIVASAARVRSPVELLNQVRIAFSTAALFVNGSARKTVDKTSIDAGR
eukprot:scaffold7340_cov266-Pinguiococcus_pyrenoidosus.AAC.73